MVGCGRSSQLWRSSARWRLCAADADRMTGSTPPRPWRCSRSRSRSAHARPARRRPARWPSGCGGELPNGRYQEVPGGLRNVDRHGRGQSIRSGRSSSARTTTPRTSLASSGRTTGRRAPPWSSSWPASSSRATSRPTIVFALFDGEESPRGSENFARDGMRGSTVAAKALDDAEAMILLDFVGDRDLSIPREAQLGSRPCGSSCESAAKRAGQAEHFPAGRCQSGARRPRPVHRPRRPVDRPHRLHLRLLPPAAVTIAPPCPSAAWTRPERRCSSCSGRW